MKEELSLERIEDIINSELRYSGVWMYGNVVEIRLRDAEVVGASDVYSGNIKCHIEVILRGDGRIWLSTILSETEKVVTGVISVMDGTCQEGEVCFHVEEGVWKLEIEIYLLQSVWKNKILKCLTNY